MSEYEPPEIAEAIIADAQTLTPLKNEPLRVCKTCGLEAFTEVDLDLFVKQKNSRLRYKRLNICKICMAKYKQKYYQKHKAKINDNHKKYRKEHKAEIREVNKKWRQENKIRLDEYRKNWRAKPENKEKRKELRKKYKPKMREWHFLYAGRRRQKSKSLNQKGKRSHQKSGYLMGDGCCMWPGCYNINPFVLQNHHPWKEDDPSFTITLCANHHEYFSRNRSTILDFFTKEE